MTEPIVVMIHVDDLGMSEAANRGGIEALEGAAKSGSIMAPCPAADEMIAIARERTDLDIGCHITLNAEFPDYRWRPLLAESDSLCDSSGNMFQTSRETIEFADQAAVAAEMRAQVSYLLDGGVALTHIDAHMGTAIDRKFFDDFVELGAEFSLPVLLRRQPDASGEYINLEHGLRWDQAHYEATLDRMAARGNPVFDRSIPGTPWYNPYVAAEHNQGRLAMCRPGLNYMAIHSAYPTAALKEFAPDWMMRDAERYLYAAGGPIEASIANMGIVSIDYSGYLAAIRQTQSN